MKKTREYIQGVINVMLNRLTKEQREQVESWRKDPCYDLSFYDPDMPPETASKVESDEEASQIQRFYEMLNEIDNANDLAQDALAIRRVIHILKEVP